MPRVLDFSKARSVPRLAQLARAAGLQGQRDDDAWLADAFVAWVRQLNAELKIPAIVEKLAPQDFGQIVRQAFAEAHGTYGVPRYMDTDDALGVLNALTPQPAH
jgi:alcohol dehydrogenase